MLHALASLSPSSTQATALPQLDDNETLPVTSYLCRWKEPSKRKESNMPVSEAVFHKHVYGRERKYDRKPLEDFDPRPPDLRGKTEDHLKVFLTKVRGQGLGVLFFLTKNAGVGRPVNRSYILLLCHPRLSYNRGLKNSKKPCVCHLKNCVKLNNQQGIKIKVLCGILFGGTG